MAHLQVTRTEHDGKVAYEVDEPADIPAWCRLTGHTLLDHHPPVYLIRRKES